MALSRSGGDEREQISIPFILFMVLIDSYCFLYSHDLVFEGIGIRLLVSLLFFSPSGHLSPHFDGMVS